LLTTLLTGVLLATDVRASDRTAGSAATQPTDAGIQPGTVLDVLEIRITIRPTGRQNEQAFYELTGVASRIRDPKDLHTRLRHMAKVSDPKITPILLNPSLDVQWRHVFEAFNHAQGAGFVHIGFIPQPDRGEAVGAKQASARHQKQAVPAPAAATQPKGAPGKTLRRKKDDPSAVVLTLDIAADKAPSREGDRRFRRYLYPAKHPGGARRGDQDWVGRCRVAL